MPLISVNSKGLVSCVLSHCAYILCAARRHYLCIDLPYLGYWLSIFPQHFLLFMSGVPVYCRSQISLSTFSPFLFSGCVQIRVSRRLGRRGVPGLWGRLGLEGVIMCRCSSKCTWMKSRRLERGLGGGRTYIVYFNWVNLKKYLSRCEYLAENVMGCT